MVERVIEVREREVWTEDFGQPADRTERVAGITAPVLVIHGWADPVHTAPIGSRS